MSGATLAACLKNALGPARVGVSVHIVCEVANALHASHSRPDPATGRPFVHGNVGPDSIVVRHDGGVELLPPSDASRAEALRTKPGHLAPEQVSAGAVDHRADVFSLGVVLWELLAGARLFERESASATRIAVVDDPIRDVREANPQVPPLLAQVLGAALERNPAGRFDSVDAFRKALLGAAASSGVAVASRAELAQWVAERGAVKVSSPSLPADVPDLDVPGASRAHRSLPRMEAVKVPSLSTMPASGSGSGSASAIPAFDVNAMAAAALAPSVRPPNASVPPSTAGRPSVPSSPTSSGRPSAPSSAGGAGAAGGGREIAFDPGDDDFDMEIERNVASTSIPVGSGPRTSTAPRVSSAHRVAGTGLELAQPSRMAREESAARREGASEPGFASKMAGTALALITACGVAFGLFHQLHRAGGRDVTRLLPHAFDGTSATESGAVALVTLVIAIVLGFLGLRLKPHAWGIVGSGGILLLLALAMVTVTLGSTGETTTPPDGVLLVPYLFPAATLFFALGLLRRASRSFSRSRGAGRAGFLPLAALAGVLIFIAFETSRLAH